MAFEDFSVVDKAAAKKGTGAKATLFKSARGTAPAKLHITLTPETAKRLDWRNNDRLQVQIGTGEHHGLIRLRKNNSVGTAVVLECESSKGPYVKIRLGHLSAFVDRREPALHVQFDEILGADERPTGWVQFVMPSWADETAPVKRPTTSRIPPSALGSPGSLAVRRDVAPSLMGDPPPGRRLALASS